MTQVLDPDNLDRFQVIFNYVDEEISIRGMGATTRHAIDETGSSAGTTTFTDAGANFTSDGVIAGDVLAIISDPAGDGGIMGHYRVVSAGTTTLVVERSITTSTAADLSYIIKDKDATGAAGETVADGVDLRALFSFAKEEWITLAAGLGNAKDLNAFDFPIVSTSNAAGQYVLGGINGDAASAWKFAADNGVESTDTEGIPRTLIRSGGWQERNATDVVISEYANYTSIPATGLDSDAAVTYQQGDATGVPADFQLTGPVNQAVLTFGPDVAPADTTNLDFAATTITRTAGDWTTDNYRLGDFITIRSAEDTPNDGSFGPITSISATVITIASASFTVNAADTTAIVSVDHRRYTVLRSRKKRRPYVRATHTDAGIPTTGILPIINKFGLLATAVDPAITLDDGVFGGNSTTDGNIFQRVDQHTIGSDGAIPAALTDEGGGVFSFTFTSAGSTFDSTARTSVQILLPGDTVQITTGTYQGTYEIKSIDSATVLTLFAEPGRAYPGVESSLVFTCRTGSRDVGATNGAIADVDGATGTLTSAGSTFDVDTGLGDRSVVPNDIVELFSGVGAHIGYYKVVSRDSATVLTLDTSDQVFTTQSAQSYRIWQPGMFLQRFSSTGTIAGASNINFADANPDTITRTGGSWTTDGFTAGMAMNILAAEDAGNTGARFIISGTPSATVITLIAEEAVTANAADTTASVNGNILGDSGITRTINSVVYPFHWRLLSHAATQAQAFQFLQRQLRRSTDIDGGDGTRRGDIESLLMTFVSPNGTTIDLFPDNLAAAEANNVTYQDISGDNRNNAFLVGITFDVNAALIAATTSRLTAYFTTNPGGNFGTNSAIIVDDETATDMDFTAISADIQVSFDYTNNAQGGRTPDSDANITVVALGDDDAAHVLVTQAITKVNAITIPVGTLSDPNYFNPA